MMQNRWVFFVPFYIAMILIAFERLARDLPNWVYLICLLMFIPCYIIVKVTNREEVVETIEFNKYKEVEE